MLDRIVISGGGTGGHIYPAIAIADEIKRRNPRAKILFVGASGKMEMEKVPQAGYKIEGLRIAGFQRSFSFSNFLLPFKIIKSLLKARRILARFKPQLVIGVGGYASGPTLKMANWLNIPTLIQEQNSYPGKTNQILAKKAEKICTAYQNMEQFFPEDKIVLTGNPVRKEFQLNKDVREEALNYYQLDPTKKTLMVMGGSLGAKTLNKSMLHHMEMLKEANIQVIWQTGKNYYNTIIDGLSETDYSHVKIMQFINRMELAYAAADVIISRSGALSVSELAIIGKPVILVPSPNVAEDHQTKNAMSLVERNAALLVKDEDAYDELIPEAITLLSDGLLQNQLATEIKKLEKPDAVVSIVDVCEQIIRRRRKK